MDMGRLSVSLDDEQEAWITATSQELGISKGKVVRECIDTARTGESLFTESVNTGELPDVDRISSLEQRLAALEEMVRNEIGSVDDDDTSSVTSPEPHSLSDGPDSTTGTVPDADQSIPPESPKHPVSRRLPRRPADDRAILRSPPPNAPPLHRDFSSPGRTVKLHPPVTPHRPAIESSLP